MSFRSFAAYLLLCILCLSSCREDDDEVVDAPQPPIDLTTLDTGLPIIVIETDDATDIDDKTRWKQGVMYLTDNQRERIFLDSIQLKGRGNASFKYPKKSFTLRFNHKQSLLGMPKHKRWVFQANYHDRTLMRNALTFHLGHLADGMEWNPHAEYAEVIFNGRHIGNYLVCEQIRVGKHRVPIDEEQAAETDCGFIYEYDAYLDGELPFKSLIKQFPVCITYPDADHCSRAQKDFAKDFIKKVETRLMVKRYESLFEKYIDLDSFVDYWIVMAITGNIEPKAPRSVYMYKKPNGKLYAGPLWDFDFSTYREADGNLSDDALYYRELFESPQFKAAVIERWNELAPTLRHEALMFISQHRSYLHQSAAINYELWPIVIPHLRKCKNGDELYPFDVAIDSLQSKAMARMDYIDSYLRQL